MDQELRAKCARVKNLSLPCDSDEDSSEEYGPQESYESDYTTKNHLIYDETNSSQIAKKASQNNIYDSFVTILDNVMEWASQIKSIDVFCVNVTD